MKKIVILIILAFISIAFVSAQDTIPPNKKKVKQEKSFLREDRPWFIEIPLWIPGFQGEFAYGDIEIDGEDGEDPGDPGTPPDPDPPGGNIWSRLFSSSTNIKFFYVGRAGYSKNRFIAQLDNVGGELGKSVKFRFNDKDVVQANIRVILTRIYAGYAFYMKESRDTRRKLKLFGYVGTRFHFIKVYSDLNKSINKLDINPIVVEPIVGLKMRLALKKWLFTIQSDCGGFYIRENLSFMTNVNAHYRLSNLLSIKVGWMDWIINHQRTFLGKDMRIRIHLSGPVAGLTFHF